MTANRHGHFEMFTHPLHPTKLSQILSLSTKYSCTCHTQTYNASQPQRKTNFRFFISPHNQSWMKYFQPIQTHHKFKTYAKYSRTSLQCSFQTFFKHSNLFCFLLFFFTTARFNSAEMFYYYWYHYCILLLKLVNCTEEETFMDSQISPLNSSDKKIKTLTTRKMFTNNVHTACKKL